MQVQMDGMIWWHLLKQEENICHLLFCDVIIRALIMETLPCARYAWSTKFHFILWSHCHNHQQGLYLSTWGYELLTSGTEFVARRPVLLDSTHLICDNKHSDKILKNAMSSFMIYLHYCSIDYFYGPQTWTKKLFGPTSLGDSWLSFYPTKMEQIQINL